MTDLDLYWAAKEAYYNGEPIMSDIEFDELEKRLGLENKSDVGTRHNPSYTIKHPFIMGSLSKVQIHKNENEEIDWDAYFEEVLSYVNKSKNEKLQIITTPKYDGCSFEVEINDNKILSISTRGDSSYGRDIKNHIINLIPAEYVNLDGHICLRGEVLIEKNVFVKKYVDDFADPRSFVSGVLNRDYNSDDDNFINMLNDLSIVIYDYRVEENINGVLTWVDKDWTKLPYTKFIPQHTLHCDFNSPEDLKTLYEFFSEVRKHIEYALDGFVIKPTDEYRISNTTEKRPKDCVAIKFIPKLQETVVKNITWKVSDTYEYTPIVWVEPVTMDGRSIQKASGHNYGWLLRKNISVGTKIILSLAGDIIPFIYKTTDTSKFDENKMNIPQNSVVNGIHLDAILTEIEKAKIDFLASASSLSIPNIGNATASQIFDYITNKESDLDDFFGVEKTTYIPTNILECRAEDVYFGSGGGKNGTNVRRSFEKVLKTLTLEDIIKSCNFKSCGSAASKQISKYLCGGNYDFAHISEIAYSWCKDENSNEMKTLVSLLSKLGKTINDYIATAQSEEEDNRIPVILTGEPNDYKSKGEFMSCHPEYRETGSWKEVKIVFTNSLDSNTGKMKKAREKGIELRLY